jgi:hypothetical protein
MDEFQDRRDQLTGLRTTSVFSCVARGSKPAVRLPAIAAFAGLAANALWGAWWLDGVVALGIAARAVIE